MGADLNNPATKNINVSCGLISNKLGERKISKSLNKLLARFVSIFLLVVYRGRKFATSDICEKSKSQIALISHNVTQKKGFSIFQSNDMFSFDK